MAGAAGTPTVRLELLGFGLIPTARVVLINPTNVPLRISRSWTYEVVPQRSLTDASLRTSVGLPDCPRTYAELAYLPEQRAWLTFSPYQLFNNRSDEPITVAPHRAWGHDHLLDLRAAKQARNAIIFVRLQPGQGTLASDWERIQLPDVPDLPLVRFTGNSRRLVDDGPFARVTKEPGTTTFVATADASKWTRVLTLATDDPLAKTLPQLLLDGKSFHLIDDGKPYRYAVTGLQDGVVDAEARVIAVQPVD